MVRITEELVRKKSEHNERLIGTLEELSLHQEDIECIEHLHNWCRDLKILLLQDNLISKIENLYKLKKLEYLNMAINNIERIENLQQLESLHKLDLTLNFIGELTSIESLRDNYNLRELILTGNPCSDFPNYREFVIATLPQLETLDCEEVTMTAKLLAQKHLSRYRAGIVQQQAVYAIQRDEQRLRYMAQKEQLDTKMANIADEDERLTTFWNSKSEHCPETRNDIAKYQKLGREPKGKKDDQTQRKAAPQLFTPCGRPYNLNQPKLTFAFKDEDAEYLLELDVYKFLDTAHLKVDVETNYVRVAVKGKIFQIVLTEEVKISEATVQRSQITGQLVVRIPKLHYDETLLLRTRKDKAQTSSAFRRNKSNGDLKGTVDIANICASCNDLPDLI